MDDDAVQSREETRLSGAIVLGNLRSLRAIAGDSAFSRAMDSIDPEVRSCIAEATTLSWVPIPHMEQLIRACAAEAGRDSHDLACEMAEQSLEHNLRTLWRVLLRFTSDDSLLQRVSLYYARSYDGGRAEAAVIAPGRAVCRVTERPGMTRMSRDIFATGVKTLLRVAGREQVRVEPRATRDGVEVDIWMS